MSTLFGNRDKTKDVIFAFVLGFTAIFLRYCFCDGRGRLTGGGRVVLWMLFDGCYVILVGEILEKIREALTSSKKVGEGLRRLKNL
jgi:hypothetical protein